MPSQYSPDLRIELIGNGEQSGTWGTTTNNNLGTLIEDAISGLASVSVTSANQALTAIYGAADEARCAALRLTTTTGAAFSIYAPPVTKIYIIQNASSYTASIYASTVLGNITAAGNKVDIPAGKTMLVRCQQRPGFPSNYDFSECISYASSFESGDTTLGNRLAATYTQTSTTVTVTTTVAHEYVNGETVAFINESGAGVNGTYTITFINSTSFSFTSPVSQATSGACFVTNDAVVVNGVINAGVVVEGSSSIPALRVSQSSTGGSLSISNSSTNTALYVEQTGSGNAVIVKDRFIINNAGEVVIGSGEGTGTTTGNTLRGPNPTGTNVAGANLIIQSGNGTGTGGSGFLSLRTAVPGSSGSTANTMVDRLKLSDGVMIGKSFDMDYGVLPVTQYYALNSNYSGSNVTTAQSIFGVGVNLAASTIYEFEMQFVLLLSSAPTTTHTISLLFSIGSGTINKINYSVLGNYPVNPTTSLTAPGVWAYFQTATANVISGASGTASAVHYKALLKGTVSIGTAGKWTPQYQLSALPGAGYATLAGSYVKIYPVGAAGANVNSGGWS